MSSAELEQPCPMCGNRVTRGEVECPHCGEELAARAPTVLDDSQQQLLRKFKRQTSTLASVWLMLSAFCFAPGILFLILGLRDLLAFEFLPNIRFFFVAALGTSGGIALVLLARGCKARKSWSVFLSVLLSYLCLAIGFAIGELLGIVLVVMLVILAHRCMRTAWRLQEAGISLDRQN